MDTTPYAGKRFDACSAPRRRQSHAWQRRCAGQAPTNDATAL